MPISVSEAIRRLDQQGKVKRTKRDDGEGVVAHVRELIGGSFPAEVEVLYRHCICSIGDFRVVLPVRSGRIGWRAWADESLTELMSVQALPLFGDGCGNLWGIDLTPSAEPRSVYFFDHELLYEKPQYAAGSNLSRFLLLLGLYDQGWQDGWPTGWEPQIDPDIDSCPRAPAIWNAR